MKGGEGDHAPPPHARHTAFEDAQGLFVGSALAAFGVAILQHLGLVSGQIAGLALLVAHRTGWGFGPVFFILNAPFYVLAWMRMGPAFTIKTVIAVVLVSVFVTVQPTVLSFAHVTPAVGAVLAGMVSGAGLLAIFRHRASLGGTGILAVYLQERTGFRAGCTQMAVDAVVFALALFTLAPSAVLLSVLGAAVLNLVIAVNHRADRYIGM